MTRLPVRMKVDRKNDGRWLCVAYVEIGDKTHVLTLGSGTVKAEAIADCKNDLPTAIEAFKREMEGA